MNEREVPLTGMIGRHPLMQAVYRQVRQYAPSMLPVTVVGETGTGKELIARAIHELSGPVSRPLVDINCAALPETLLEAELFGWEKGAFTGAGTGSIGLLEAASGGTLFLDEAGSLSLAAQAKLLRVLENREFRRVGGRVNRSASFRLVLALAEAPYELVAAGGLRPDFVYRTATLALTLPPLRARGADLGTLAAHFLSQAGTGSDIKTLTQDAHDLLHKYRWPGNVRELKALMERIQVVCPQQAVDMTDLLEVMPVLAGEVGASRERIVSALRAHSGSVAKAALALQISRAGLYIKIKHFGIEPRDWSSEH